MAWYLQLSDGIGDQAPDRCPLVIAFCSEIVGAAGSLSLGIFAITFEHQRRGPPDAASGNPASIEPIAAAA